MHSAQPPQPAAAAVISKHVRLNRLAVVGVRIHTSAQSRYRKRTRQRHAAMRYGGSRPLLRHLGLQRC